MALVGILLPRKVRFSLSVIEAERREERKATQLVRRGGFALILIYY